MDIMKKINLKGLLLSIFVPTTVFSLCYLIIGFFCKSIPNILLFCVLATIILVPVELGCILFASKKEYGDYSLKSAFVNQEKLPMWKILVSAFVFIAIAGLLSAFVTPVEMKIWANVRASLLQILPVGFDWRNFEYIASYPKPVVIATIVYYGIFNVLVGPITEELFFRGYLTSHYEKQGKSLPIVISVLFSLYHFWLPFDNVFRILSFLPVYYYTYKKKNVYIGIWFHCLCNLVSVISFSISVL